MVVLDERWMILDGLRGFVCRKFLLLYSFLGVTGPVRYGYTPEDKKRNGLYINNIQRGLPSDDDSDCGVRDKIG